MQLQIEHPLAAAAAPKSAEILRAVKAAFIEKGFDGASTVSYTHLTLPTSDLV